MRGTLDEWIENNEHAKRFRDNVRTTLEVYDMTNRDIDEVVRTIMICYRQEITEL